MSLSLDSLLSSRTFEREGSWVIRIPAVSPAEVSSTLLKENQADNLEKSHIVPRDEPE